MAADLLRNEPITPETLDSAEVYVLVDNVSEGMSTVPVGVTDEALNLVKAGAKQFSGESLCRACWGLSLVVTGHIGSRAHSILFDAGPAS
jgi:7,8-dihydropterin-6-yl-methyl-4-(beta-D-ribofuranosyl)aminobenzene 5'-phosphate synthase